MKTKWIWQNTNNNSDEYVKFVEEFSLNKPNAQLTISCDSNYNAYLNGKLIAFGQYADYPHFKVCDKIDLSAYARQGKNLLVVVVWYYGENSQCYTKGNAGLYYQVESDGTVICYSSKATKCAVAQDFVCYKKRFITGQLGLSYCYDSRYYDGYDCTDYEPKGFENAVEIQGISYDLHESRIKKLILRPLKKAQLVNQEKRIFDLGRESVGFLQCRIKAPEGKRIRIAYGEHLDDGEVRWNIGGRDFTVELISNGEFFEFRNTFRRLGCRYLQVLEDCEIDYIGLLETDYPIKRIPHVFDDKELQQIYDVGVRTLELCMHEHYEDTPWREQCLYSMDSRNQMLFGYEAFGETNFARANLELMGKGVKADGLLPLCFPAGCDVPIPFFSLIYIKSMLEYAEYSKDCSLLEEYYQILTGIVDAFLHRQEENGLIAAMRHYWNFYEWSSGMDGITGNELLRESTSKRYDLPLNAFVVLALYDLRKINALLHKPFAYEAQLNRLKDALESFYIPEKGIYRTYLCEDERHVSKLANALAVLALPKSARNKEIAAFIKADNGYDEVTLSMKVFEFDALLSVDEKNSVYVVEKIRKDYGYMLSKGGTSFWETIMGAADFGGAGSLCHGWSALPVYYLSKLVK